MEAGQSEEATLFPARVGDKLRAARAAAGLDLPVIAERTRIPQRHLEAIESSNYSGLPSITYAMGFAKAYARQVGLDEVAIARDLRAELADAPVDRAAPVPAYEFTGPARVPPRGLALFGVVLALLVIVGAGIWYGTDWFHGGPSAPNVVPIEPPSAATPSPAPAPPATPTPVAGGQVRLTATDTVWVRVYDAGGKSLFEKTMNAGDAYDVPADANQPMINVGRPDLLTITINGSAIPPLGTAEHAIKDVLLTAEALRARSAGQPLPVATPVPSASAPVAAAPTPDVSASSATPRAVVRRAPRRPAAASTPASAPAPVATSTPRPLLPPGLLNNSAD